MIAERAAGRDDAGRKALRVAIAAHFGIGDARERGCGGNRGAADGGEAAAGGYSGNAKPATQMADKRVGGAE